MTKNQNKISDNGYAERKRNPGVFREKYKYIFLLVLILLGVFSFSPLLTQVEALSFQELLDERSVSIWIEGQPLGEMVIGSRAQLIFVYLDKKIIDKGRGDPDVPQWFSWNSQHYDKALKKKKGIFIVRFKTFRSWNFNPEMLSVADYTLQQEDVITRKAFRLEGEIPSDAIGSFAIMVPLDILEKGHELLLSCGEFSRAWKVPR